MHLLNVSCETQRPLLLSINATFVQSTTQEKLWLWNSSGVLEQPKSFWGWLMYFINPHSSLCFDKTVGSIKNVQSFRFPHLILFIQLRAMETSRIQFVLESWSSVRLALDWESAVKHTETHAHRKRQRGGKGSFSWHLYIVSVMLQIISSLLFFTLLFGFLSCDQGSDGAVRSEQTRRWIHTQTFHELCCRLLDERDTTAVDNSSASLTVDWLHSERACHDAVTHLTTV